jgi:serine phosphatase RsbU (regulator of sigma subunit)/Tfp pilus assembly protein PilF
MYLNQGKKPFFLLYFLLAIASPVFAQQKVADSIKSKLGFLNDSNKVHQLLKLSDAYSKYSPKKAIESAEEAKMLANQIGNEQLEAQSLQTLGRLNSKIGRPTEAITFYEAARTIYIRTGNSKSAAKCLLMTTDAYLNIGKYDQALNTSFDAYREYESLGDKSGMAAALIGSGRVYEAMENYNKAILDYEKALGVAKEANDLPDEASCLNNLANVYGRLGKNDTAITYLEEAGAIYEKLNDSFNYGKVLNNIGTVYQDLSMAGTDKEDLAMQEKAENYFLKALDVRKSISDNRGTALTLANLGGLMIDKKEFDKAIDYLGRALGYSKKSGAADIELAIYEYTSEAYKQKADFEKAFEFAMLGIALKDSLFDDNLSKGISEAQAKYGVEKAEADKRAAEKERTLIVWASAIVGILLIIFVFFLWNRAVTRKRVNTKLNQQKEEIEKKNSALNEANVEIRSKNKDITDSIQYARRIQEAILPEVEFSGTFGNSAFVLYRPKDIVSGDFYWMAQTADYLLFAAVDCTGHGVPGAFVSIVCSNLLSQSVKEQGLTRPDEILNDVNVRLSQTLRQRQDESRVRDGMDIALCCIHKKTLHLTFAGAFNPAWIIRGETMTELLPDKFPVGLFEEEELRSFTYKEMQLEKGDRIYVFSDGYSDQFGGALGKKYKRSTFQAFVKEIQSKPISEHGRLLSEEHIRWKGTNDQIDDILVLGVEV